MEPYALNIVQPNGKDQTVYQFFDIVVNDPLRLFKGDPFRAFTPLGWQKIVQPAPDGPADAPPPSVRRESADSKRTLPLVDGPDSSAIGCRAQGVDL